MLARDPYIGFLVTIYVDIVGDIDFFRHIRLISNSTIMTITVIGISAPSRANI